jgi:hypothetical protein
LQISQISLGKFMRLSIRLPTANQKQQPGACAEMVAASLRVSPGGTHAAVKTAAVWTGARERTAKNWLSGRSAPSGDHLIGLAMNSDTVLEGFLQLAGQRQRLVSLKILEAMDAIRLVLVMLERLSEDFTDA